MKKVTDFFDFFIFYISQKKGIKTFLKWYINKCPKGICLIFHMVLLKCHI